MGAFRWVNGLLPMGNTRHLRFSGALARCFDARRRDDGRPLRRLFRKLAMRRCIVSKDLDLPPYVNSHFAKARNMSAYFHDAVDSHFSRFGPAEYFHTTPRAL